MDLYRPTSLTIQLDRLIENFKMLRSFNPEHAFVCPMIKANAYGHGDIAVAKALISAQCENLGVSSVEEAVHLKESYVDANILVFGFRGRPAAKAIVENNFTPVVSDYDQLTDLCMNLDGPLNIHLKFNTGMNRLGFKPHEVKGVLNVLEKNEGLNLVGIGTHFHTGSEISIEHSTAWKQNEVFKEMTAAFASKKPLLHAYNSAAITALYKVRRGFKFGFRPGLLVYGIDPSENLTLKPLVSPVMKFKSKIVSLQQVKLGEVVSYGGVWTAPKDSLIGIVPAGYADGVCRSLSNKGEFLVRGQRVPIRGKVCMDYTMVDLTDVKGNVDTLAGEEVILIGAQGSEEITVEEVATKVDRVTYEVMTGVSERVPRIYGAGE